MSSSELRIQDEWNAYPLRNEWPLTPDNIFMFRRLADVPVEATADGARGRLLEVAAAEASHACRLNKLGLEAVVVEPSSAMLTGARKRMQDCGAQLMLIRGIAETLPFRDHTFDRVLCDSALDHLADPERGIREMARVTAPDGRVVLTFVNYGSATVRVSRLLYRIGRALGLVPPEREKEKLFWDTPVPHEHNFECSLANVSDMCRPYLELDHAYGVSFGWMFPGWGRVLERYPRMQRWLPRLDRLAHRHPALADFVVSVWRRRPNALWPSDQLRVRRNNPVYQRHARLESVFWQIVPKALQAKRPAPFFEETSRMMARVRDRAFTGRADCTWVEDLASRGPFTDVAMLGCDDEEHESAWLRAGGSSSLDVFELSRGRIEECRARLGDLAARVRFVPCDLNFVELRDASYDCIWSSGTLHFVTNLEHLYTQVARALRPGGLFAFSCYIGEPRQRYDPARLERLNAILQSVPERYRRVEAITPPEPAFLSPFQAVRSRDILPLAHARFEPVRVVTADRLMPLWLMIDLPAIVREDPALFARLTRAEEDVRDDPVMQPCGVYAIFRKRDGSAGRE